MTSRGGDEVCGQRSQPQRPLMQDDPRGQSPEPEPSGDPHLQPPEPKRSSQEFPLCRKPYGLVGAFLAGIVGGLVAHVLFVGTVVFAQKASQPGNLVRADKFELVDQDGKPRAALGLGSNGEPALGLFDITGKPRAGLSLRPDGEPALELYDSDGKNRATFGYTELQTVSTEPLEKRPIFSIVLFDKSGKVIWQAP